MQLQKLSFTDHQTGWQLLETEFYPDLTLLVGVTGVGKTRILQAVRTMRQVAEGGAPPGVELEAVFSDGANQYSWNCQFETTNIAHDGDGPSDVARAVGLLFNVVAQPRVVREVLTADGEELIARDETGIRLRGKATPKLSPHNSALMMLSLETGVAAAHQCFTRVSEESDVLGAATITGSTEQMFDKYSTIDDLRGSQLNLLIKLAIAEKSHRDVFQQIASQFMDVFPQVEALRVERHRVTGTMEVLALAMREVGIAKWIRDPYIASGMKRTLAHLARIALWPDGTLFLIDEFENSLGINCIDYVTKSLLEEGRCMQFIITSHHPYIINNISPDHWKIVSRKGYKVTTQNASELGLEQSSHQAFIKLLNTEAYQEGVAAG